MIVIPENTHGNVLVSALSVQYGRARSFYGKAHVVQYQHHGIHHVELHSYETLVAYSLIDISGNERVWLTSDFDRSVTTLRHVHEFLRQRGCDDTTANLRKLRPLCAQVEGYLNAEGAPLDYLVREF